MCAAVHMYKMPCAAVHDVLTDGNGTKLYFQYQAITDSIISFLTNPYYCG